MRAARSTRTLGRMASVAVLAITLGARPLSAQVPVAAIDSIFARWDGSSTPGCVCTIANDRDVLFESAYGMADLEQGTPLEPESVFYVASVSKQFVASSVALLALDGAFALEDDARRLLPPLSGIDVPIRILDLGGHTSGIRDYFSLHRLSGHHERDHLDNPTVLHLLTLQRSLEFAPGTSYAYSNSNYVLLAELVRRTSGQTLREFTRTRLFEPLGMAATHFEDDHREVVAGRVSSYEPVDETYRRFVKQLDVVGDGGLLSTTRDLTRWGRNLLDPRVGGPELLRILTRPTVLADGTPVDYGFGLRLDRVAGRPTIGHTGSYDGFRTRLLVVPSERLVFVVLCNTADADASRLTETLATRWLGPDPAGTGPSDPAAVPPASEPLPTEARMRGWTGDYWDDESGLARRIFLEDGALHYGREATASELVPVGGDVFSMPGFGIPISLTFSRDPAGVRHIEMQVATFQTVRYREFEPVTEAEIDPAALIGRYRSEELDVDYEIRRADDGLELEAGSFARIGRLVPVMEDVFAATIGGDRYVLRVGRVGTRVERFRLDSGLSHGVRFVRSSPG